MASVIENVINPAFYKRQWGALAESATAYYRPLLRSSSVKPLWHIMLATSVVMYTTNYVALKGSVAQAARKERQVALEEYYEKHGKSGHH
eukprot:CAMPEP_0113560978 /NCGR_PEP_ID=MMETSP0015_2-20120614/19731_1 /TAXON_ID=2838 /ORGANISM="Odontella" /LENGTH=89 /DNA_ID=CAMNT_0000462743 /DNA_START=37 /DNA_END=306 /DNA_ORIENTATION=+ /assembly_acc=CAM_ASM_000160